MVSIQYLPARRCLTACGILIIDHKVMLVKHKKLGIWLAPGGHIDEHELPHQAAEREFWEETGIKVEAWDPGLKYHGDDSEYLPNPFLSNLHWIAESNYQARLASDNPTEPQTSAKFPRGCEQHFCSLYLVKALGSLEFKENTEESEGIGWFTEKEVNDLPTTTDIKYELKIAFQIWKDHQK